VKFTDVTIREAAQMPGRSYSAEQRVEAALAIDRLEIAQIETGFPAAGETERRVTAELADRLDARTVAIARAVDFDIEAALDANADVIEVFAPVSDLHLEHYLDRTRAEILDAIESGVTTARDGGAAVRISILGAFRTDIDHLRTVLERFDHVARIGLADTVGCRTPQSVRRVLDELAKTTNLERISVHFHNDIGCGTANVLTAARAGVGNADVAVGALGERVGNPALEEIVVASDINHDDDFGVETTRLIPVAREVMDALGEEISPQKPVLGMDATRHEAGLHTAAMFEEPGLFEPFDPARYGGTRTLVFGERSGRGAARAILDWVDVDPTDATVAEVLDLFEEYGPLDREDAVALVRRKFG
jgi:isopropylmalate/homocitrate/citramalate synthase